MTSVLMPFLMSMLLGRTIDLTTYNIGAEVYDGFYHDKTKVNEFVSTYTVLQGNAFPYSYVGLPVDIVLRIKAGFLSSSSGSMGLDGLLKETTWKQRSAVIAVTSAVQTIRRSLKKDAQPLPWSSRISHNQTHYANSIIYGGWSFILYRLKCEIPGDAEIVRETLTSALGYHGDMGHETIKLWENATDAIRKNPEIRGKVTVQINTYSTFPFEQNFSSPQGLLSAVSEVPKLVGPIGKPMMMELLPLHDLDEQFPVVEENHKLDSELEKIDEMFDDVKNTKNSINRWVSKTDTFTDEQEEKIAGLLTHLSSCIKLFHEVASEASVYKNMDENLLKSAMRLYGSGLQHYTKHSYTYDRIFRRLKEDFDTECEDSFYQKIKGLLQVDDSEKVEVGRVEGGLEDCRAKCLAEPRCRSIGYADRIMSKMVTDTTPPILKLVMKEKLCYIYFRSTSSADVLPSTVGSVTAIYDRKCQSLHA